eukprot:3205260-Pyramimonas_sp.AAC.1
MSRVAPRSHRGGMLAPRRRKRAQGAPVPGYTGSARGGLPALQYVRMTTSQFKPYKVDPLGPMNYA